MALGKKFWVWDEDDMLAGVSTSDDLSDGGFSPLTDAINLIASPGIAYQPTTPTDKSTNVTGTIIASAEDPLILGATRTYVDDEGHYYTWNGTTMTLARTDATNPSGYVPGTTDMNAYENSVFTTTNTTVVKWTVDSVFTDNFITGLAGGVRHPLLTYEGFQYIGDGNLLKRMTDTSDSTPDTILTLAVGQNIVALGIDPGSGKMLISTSQGFNYSDTLNTTNKVLYYNGFSNKVDKVVPMDDLVTAFPFTEGQLYIAYGQNLGYWNGAGATFLKKFEIGFIGNELMYKHHFTNIGPTLYVIEKTKLWAHGPIRQGGEKVFYPAYKNQVNSNNLQNVAYVGSNILTFGFTTDKFYTFDTVSVAASNTQVLYSNENPLEAYNDGVWLRRIKVFWKNQVSNNVDPGSIRLFNEDGVITTIGQSGLLDLRNTSGAAKALKEIDVGGGTGTRIQQIQFELILDTVNPGIRRIEFYGDPANQTTPQS